MKQLFTSLMMLILSFLALGQSPNGMSYQAVLRGSSNELLVDQEIGMQISILQGLPDGVSVYTETHNPITNNNGLVSIVIGEGISSDDFSSVDWSNGPYFIKTEIDQAGGNDYSLIGVSQLLSVPYAMYAKQAANVFSGEYDSLKNKPDLSVYSMTDTRLDESAVDSMVSNNGYIQEEQDGDSTNELQFISIEGDTIRLSEGGSIILPNDSVLSESAVDSMVSNNGYIQEEQDGDSTNELQFISIEEDTIRLSEGGSIILPSDSVLSESAVDSMVSNNGYIQEEQDGDITNELQELSVSFKGDTLYLSKGNWLIVPGISNANSSKFEPRVVLNLDPSVNNPRNSEGDFIRLNNGRLLYVYTHYYDGNGVDHDPAYLASRYSDDDGETWSVTDQIEIENEGVQNIMSVSLLRLQNGNIALFYLVKNSLTDCMPYLRISSDEAITWGNPIKCIQDKEGYFTLNNDRVIQLGSGRLLLPVAYYHNSTAESFDPYGLLHCYYSDDNGLTWGISDTVPNDNNKMVQEPGVIEMSDGRIMMFARSNEGEQLVSFSSDSGLTWTNVELSGIKSPVSPATIEKDPETGVWLMVWNNNDGTNPDISGVRTPLTIATSEDDGLTWERVTDLETNPAGWFCYTAIYFYDDNIIISYCSGDDIWRNGLNYTTVNKFSKSWLYNLAR